MALRIAPHSRSPSADDVDRRVRARRRVSLLAPAVARRRRVAVRSREETRDRSIRLRIQLVWSLLFLNVLTFYSATWSGEPLLLPIPHRIGPLPPQRPLPPSP